MTTVLTSSGWEEELQLRTVREYARQVLKATPATQ